MAILSNSIRNADIVERYPNGVFEVIADTTPGSFNLRFRDGDDLSVAQFFSSREHMVGDVLNQISVGRGSFYWSGEASGHDAETEAIASWRSKTPEERADEAEAKLAEVWEALLQESKDRGWCGEYDRFAKKFGGPVRTSMQLLYGRFEIRAELPYSETDEERHAAFRALTSDQRLDAKKASIESILRYVDSITEEQRTEVAETLAAYIYDPETR